MVHTHNMAEDMLNFQIDTTTRKLVNVSGRKGFLVQGDHDSKIVVFEMPRVVEGHDMAECNEVRVHYINISKNRKRKKEGVYEVLDKTVSESGESIHFSWKISGNATEICGTLYFLIQFSCVPDDIDYVWNTEICKEIRVSEGIDNSGVVAEEYADILEQWKQRLFGNEDCLEERLTEISGRIADNSKGIKENKEDIAQKADKANPTFTGSMSMNRKDGTKIGDKSTALGENNEASGVWSFVTGVGNVATHMKSSVVSGENNVVKSNNGIASGFNNGVFGHCSCAEGNGNQIGTEDDPDSRNKAMCCHAEGKDNIIDKHSFIHVQGLGNIGKGSCSDVSGKYNIPDEDSKYAKIVGNGASDKNRSNAHTLDWKGNGWFAGKLSQEGQPANAKDLTTKKYVDDKISENIVVIEKDFASMETPEFCLNDLFEYEKSGIYVIKSTSQDDISYVNYYYVNTIDDGVEHISVFHWISAANLVLLVNCTSMFGGDMFITFPNNSVLHIGVSDDDGSKYGKFIEDPINTEFTLKVNDKLYDGSNLSLKHSNEIRKYSDVWAWIKARIKNNNFAGIHVGDYIPMNAENGNQTYNMQIAGIDTYYNTQDLKIGHHIDFISKECYIRPFQWNTTANNNGTSAKNSPYLASNIYKVLGELASAVLPQEVQNQIVEKKTIIERRYSSGGALTASTTQSVQYIGKLWLPSEYEVFGSVIRGTPEWSQGQAVQYPLFANSGKNRAKIMVGSNKIVNWWLLTTHYGDTTHICTVGKNASINGASNYTIYFPICFRIDDSVTG